ncbi:MAG TPA: methyltransferase domain-containing protein [Polyangiaceae bacterium]|nr:methyltransferase domain-containing protein [Polyangiaceae bacterium]
MENRTYEDNNEAIEAWNTVLFDKYVRFRDTLTRGLAVHGNELLERHPVRPGSRVLDVGCGFGDTTLDLARRTGEGGVATGVDAAARFIDVARREAEQAGVKNARFVVADVEREGLGGPYDRGFARFGTMFFASPVAALRNVRRSLERGSPFTMVVWRRKDENPWLYDVEQRVLQIVQPPEKTEQVTCGPGPFSMASADVTSAQLKAAGFDRIAFERFDADIRLGSDLDDAVEITLALGPAGEIMRLAGEEAQRRKPEVAAAVREVLSPKVRDGAVYGASSAWLVSARAA